MAFNLFPSRIKLVLAGGSTEEKIDFAATLTAIPGDPYTSLDAMNPLDYEIAVTVGISDPLGNLSPVYKVVVPVGGLSETSTGKYDLNSTGSDRTGLEKFSIAKSGATWTIELKEQHYALPSIGYASTSVAIALTKPPAPTPFAPHSGSGGRTLINNGVTWTTN